MSKSVVFVAALAGGLLTVFGAAPATAHMTAGAKSAKAKHGHSVRWHARHKVRKHRARGFHHRGRHYPARFRFGARADCAYLARRAYKTGDAYWGYAAKSCRADRHYHY